MFTTTGEDKKSKLFGVTRNTEHIIFMDSAQESSEYTTQFRMNCLAY